MEGTRIRLAGVTAALVVCALLPSAAFGAQDDLVLVTRADGPNGAPANSQTGFYDSNNISADGCRVAFNTDATNLTGDALNTATNVFVRDICAGRTILASRANGLAGASANFDCDWASISSDGHWVVFATKATNLGGSPTGGNVYVRNIDTNQTLLASVRSNGTPLNDPSQYLYPTISGNGNFVAYNTDISANLIDPTVTDSNGQRDVLVRNMSQLPAGGSKAASRTAGGTTSDGDSVNAKLADTGALVFDSDATDLDAAHPGKFGFYLYQSTAGTTPPSAFLNSSGQPIKGGSAGISADGSMISFGSDSLLTGEPFIGNDEIFTLDFANRGIQAASRQSGVKGDLACCGPEESYPSGNGRFVAYQASDISLAEGATLAGADPGDIFVRDRLNQTTFVASRGPGGLAPAANAASYSPSFSADGRYLTFATEATNLLPGVNSGVQQLYRREIVEPSLPNEGNTVNVRPLSGNTTITLPDPQSKKKKKGKRKRGKKRALPTTITSSTQLPVGTIVDVTAGRIELTDNFNGVPESTKFYDGAFKVEQDNNGDPVLTAHLAGNTPCDPGNSKKKKKKGKRRRKKRLASNPLAVGGPLAVSAGTTTRSLWGKGRGNYRTRGHRGSATVRGTEWLTIDTCRGKGKRAKGSTSFQVATGTVTIDDFGKKGAVNATLTPGGQTTYSAKATSGKHKKKKRKK